MDRREVIRIALRSGVVLLLSPIPEIEGAGAAEDLAASKRAKGVPHFWQGTLAGAAFHGWQALLASTGTAVYGTIFDPASLGAAHFTGFRLRGTLKKGLLSLNLFALPDLDFTAPVGSGQGHVLGRRGSAQLQVQSPAAAGGTLKLAAVPLNARRTHRVLGRYQVTVHAPDGSPMGGGTGHVQPGGKLSFTSLSLDGAVNLPGKVAGRYAVAHDGSAYLVTMLPSGLDAALLGFDPSEVNRIQQGSPAAGVRASGGDMGGDCLIQTCAGISCQPPEPELSSVTLLPDTVAGGGRVQVEVELTAVVTVDTTVELASSDPDVASFVEASVQIKSGDSIGRQDLFTHLVFDPAVVTITASYSDAKGGAGADADATLEVNPFTSGPILQRLTVDPQEVTPAPPYAAVTATLELAVDAPAGGIFVPLAADKPIVAADMPGAALGVSIPEGKREGSQQLHVDLVTQRTQVTISAAIGHESKSAVLTVDPSAILGSRVNCTVYFFDPFYNQRRGPIIGATVKIVELGRTATTDSMGNCTFDTVPAGLYTFRALKTGLTGADASIQVGGGDAIGVGIDMVQDPDTFGILGEVTDQNTHPIAQARVEVVGGNNSTITGSDGTYELEGLQGTVNVRASADGYQDATVQLQGAGSGRGVQDFTLSPA